jgi:hypothetical protein
MKNKPIFIILSFFMAIGIVFSFTTCKKETDCTAIITVKRLSDTTQVVQSANVKLTRTGVSEALLLQYVEGVSDVAGQFKHTFQYEAILDVIATKDTASGASVVRLKPGQTVYKTVFLDI